MANLNSHLRVELPKEWIKVRPCGKERRMSTSWRVCAHGFGTWRLFLKKCPLGELQCSKYSFQRAELMLLQLVNIRASKMNKARILWIPLRLHQSKYCWAQAMRDLHTHPNHHSKNTWTGKLYYHNNEHALETKLFSVPPRATTSNYSIVQTGYVRYMKGYLRSSRTFAAIRKNSRR